jgi:hypothetical protein
VNASHNTSIVPEIVSKSEFAAMTNVTPGRVSQWIKEGKIRGEALVGQGRAQRIRSVLACAQLKRSIDSGQRVGNGLGTRLDPAQAPAPPADAQVLPFVQSENVEPIDTIEEQIKREKLEELQRRNRRSAVDDAERLRRLVVAETVSQEMGRLASRLVGIGESSLADFAAAISAKYNIPQRDLLHLLRGEQRRVRSVVVDAVRRAGANIPETVEVEIPDHGES